MIWVMKHLSQAFRFTASTHAYPGFKELSWNSSPQKIRKNNFSSYDFKACQILLSNSYWAKRTITTKSNVRNCDFCHSKTLCESWMVQNRLWMRHFFGIPSTLTVSFSELRRSWTTSLGIFKSPKWVLKETTKIKMKYFLIKKLFAHL